MQKPPITKKQLKGYLGREVFRQVLDVYMQSSIKCSHNTADKISISAKLMYKGDIFDISSNINSSGRIETTSCSCGRKSPCEHVGAAILYYIKHPDSGTKTNERPKVNEHLKMNESSQPTLVFIMKKVHDKWIIKSAIYDKTSSQLTIMLPEMLEDIKINDSSMDLFNLINKTAGYSLPLSSTFEILSKKKDIELYLETDYRQKPLIAVKNFELLINFKLKQLNGTNTTFLPDATIKLPDSDDINSGAQIEIIPTDKDDQLIILIPDKSRIIFCKANPHFIKLYSSKNFFSISEIKALKHATAKSDEISINFPYSGITVRQSVAEIKPMIEIKEYSLGITLALKFIIGEDIVPYDPETAIGRINKDSSHLTFQRIDTKFQTTNYLILHNLIAGRIIRENNGPSEYHFSLACNFQQFILEYGISLLDAGFEIRRKGKKIRHSSGVNFLVKVTREYNWLDLEIGIEDENGNYKKIKYDKNKIEDLLYFENEFIIVNKEEIEKLRLLLTIAQEKNGKIQISPYNQMFWENFKPYLDKKEDKELARIRDSLNRLKDFTSIEEVSSPDNFKGILRPYQSAGLSWLYFLYKNFLNGCLADDMGLGKTVQTIALLQKIKNENKLDKVLIVVPVSLIANWENEINQFSTGLRVVKHYGLGRDVKKLKDSEIILISYHTLRNDLEELKKISFTYLILDEAQAIKNRSTKISGAVRCIKAEHRLTLTGTPVENSITDIWSQMDFLIPGLLGTEKDFSARYVKPIESLKNSEKTAELRKIVYPFILRRKKEEVEKDLPEKEEITLFLEMADDQRKFYNETREYYRDLISNQIEDHGLAKSSIAILQALLKLRQAAIFPFLVDKTLQHISSCKYDLLKDILPEIFSEGYKTIIFSQFIGSLTKIESYLSKEKYKYSYLDGSTKNRETQINNFQTNPAVKAFLVSLKAGGTGLNLTAASYVILFDPWWNPAVERQAVDRAHRIGQQKKVTAYRLIVKDTIEEKIMKMQEDKKKLAENLITEESSFIKSLKRDDVDFLFT